MESLVLPRSSKPTSLTFTIWPSLRTSCGRFTRSLEICETWTSPSLAPKKFTKAPKSTTFTTLPV